MRNSYCSVEASGIDDLSSEGAKVKVYVVNSFVERQGYLLNETSTHQQLSSFRLSNKPKKGCVVQENYCTEHTVLTFFLWRLIFHY